MGACLVQDGSSPAEQDDHLDSPLDIPLGDTAEGDIVTSEACALPAGGGLCINVTSQGRSLTLPV